MKTKIEDYTTTKMTKYTRGMEAASASDDVNGADGRSCSGPSPALSRRRYAAHKPGYRYSQSALPAMQRTGMSNRQAAYGDLASVCAMPLRQGLEPAGRAGTVF